MKRLIPVTFVITALFANAIFGASVGWRTDGTGCYPQATPPVEWSLDKNIVWSTSMPGNGNATPVIIGEKLFVCSEPDKLLCISLNDGKILWQNENSILSTLESDEIEAMKTAKIEGSKIKRKLKPLIREKRTLARTLKKDRDNEELKQKVSDLKHKIALLTKELQPYEKYSAPKTHSSNGYSTPTPVSDGQHIYVAFGTGVVVCYDLDGNKQWAKIIEKSVNSWGHSASPVLTGGKLIVHVLNVTAFDAKTGKIVWEAPSKARWGSPVLMKIGDKEVVITANGEIIRASDGKVLKNKISAVSFCAPIVNEDIVYFVENGGAAVKLSGKADESLNAEVLWNTMPKKDRYYGSPVYYDGLLYAITRGSQLSVIDSKDGSVVYSKKLDFKGGYVYPSPAEAGGNIYISHDSGTTIVLKPGREYVEIAKNQLEGFRSCPVFHGDKLYIRTLKKLYCIGNK